MSQSKLEEQVLLSLKWYHTLQTVDLPSHGKGTAGGDIAELLVMKSIEKNSSGFYEAYNRCVRGGT